MLKTTANLEARLKRLGALRPGLLAIGCKLHPLQCLDPGSASVCSWGGAWGHAEALRAAEAVLPAAAVIASGHGHNHMRCDHLQKKTANNLSRVLLNEMIWPPFGSQPARTGLR